MSTAKGGNRSAFCRGVEANTGRLSTGRQINQGGYPVTLTVDWSAQFSANGGGFQGIPDVMHTFEGRQQVRQIQSVVTR